MCTLFAKTENVTAFYFYFCELGKCDVLFWSGGKAFGEMYFVFIIITTSTCAQLYTLFQHIVHFLCQTKKVTFYYAQWGIKIQRSKKVVIFSLSSEPKNLFFASEKRLNSEICNKSSVSVANFAWFLF